ncbi:MAG: DUF6268 family outer membrane beta-barrel protein [Myxococcota bacterium]
MPSHSEAQEIVRTDVRYVGAGELQGAEDEVDGVSLSTLEFRGAFTLPIVLQKSGTILIAGANYSWLSPSTSGVDGAAEPDNFQEVGVTVGAVIPFGPRWSLRAMFAPSLASNFEEASTDAWNFRSVAAASVLLSEKTTFSFGLVGSYQFGSLLPLPIVSIDWRPTASTSLVTGFPEGVQVRQFLGDRFLVGARLGLEGSQYFIGGSGDEEGFVDHLQTTQLEAGPVVGLRIASALWLEAFGGYTLYRNLNIFDGGNDSFLDAQLDNSFVFQGSLVIRPPMPPPEPEPASFPDD